MPFSTKAFKGLVSHTHREIVSAKYKIQNTYHEATINSIEEKESEPYMIRQEIYFIKRLKTLNSIL